MELKTEIKLSTAVSKMTKDAYSATGLCYLATPISKQSKVQWDMKMYLVDHMYKPT